MSSWTRMRVEAFKGTAENLLPGLSTSPTESKIAGLRTAPAPSLPFPSPSPSPPSTRLHCSHGDAPSTPVAARIFNCGSGIDMLTRISLCRSLIPPQQLASPPNSLSSYTGTRAKKGHMRTCYSASTVPLAGGRITLHLFVFSFVPTFSLLSLVFYFIFPSCLFPLAFGNHSVTIHIAQKCCNNSTSNQRNFPF